MKTYERQHSPSCVCMCVHVYAVAHVSTHLGVYGYDTHCIKQSIT